jgi:hypothetical protein
MEESGKRKAGERERERERHLPKLISSEVRKGACRHTSEKFRCDMLTILSWRKRAILYFVARGSVPLRFQLKNDV